MSSVRNCGPGGHEWTTTIQVSDTVLHRTCGICGDIEEDVFISQGHTVTIAISGLTIAISGLSGLTWTCTCGAAGATDRRTDALRHVEDAPGDGVVVADAGHTFRISVECRGSGKVTGDAHHRDEVLWEPIPNSVEVRAWSLAEALEKAAALPFNTWFESDSDGSSE